MPPFSDVVNSSKVNVSLDPSESSSTIEGGDDGLSGIVAKINDAILEVCVYEAILLTSS